MIECTFVCEIFGCPHPHVKRRSEMNREQINVVIEVHAELMIDKDEWPDDWDIQKEIGHQLSLDDAIEYSIESVKVVGP